jgi:cyclophilin family peptidyl-prolyl cis-trans isomerase
MTRFRAALLAALLVPAMLARAIPAAGQDAGPVIVVETSAGTFAFETFPDEAPKTVAHILELVRSRFYDGQRFHRAIPGFVVQWGDPQTKSLEKSADWGSGDAASSGKPVGVSEMSKKRLHVKGAVGVAHMGDPAKADSQIYVTLAARPDLNGRYTVFGRLIAGNEVPERIQKGDQITRMYVKE